MKLETADPSSNFAAFVTDGYEIAAAGQSSAQAAVTAWTTSSSGHNDVILTQGDWDDLTWLSMGCGAGRAIDKSEKWWFVWFSEDVDPNGTPT